MTLNEWIDHLTRERDTNPGMGDADVVLWPNWPKGQAVPVVAPLTYACYGPQRWAIVETKPS